MLEHTRLSTEARHKRRTFWEGLTGIDQLWVHTLSASFVVGERERRSSTRSRHGPVVGHGFVQPT
jgi:hypothetical protein